MTPPSAASTASASLPPRHVVVVADPAPALDVPLARRVLGEAILLGITADALLRVSLRGVALPVWTTLAALALVSLTWTAGRRVSREVAAWLATAVVFAVTVAWRDAETLDVAGIFATIGALLMAAVASHPPQAAIFAARVRDLLFAAATRLRTAAAGWAPLVLGEAIVPREEAGASGRAAPALRAAGIALVLLVVFGALLRSADPIFASLVALPDVDIGTVASHIIFAGFFAWLVSGWARAALDARPAPPIPSVPSLTLGTLEVTTALGALNALFALYVLTQLGWFFGGEHFLQARTGLTAAEYARQGFFQVVLVVLLVVPLLLATRAMLAPDRALARRHTALSLPLLGLLGAIIVSAASRMRLYVHYYGLTTDRVYPMAFMAWLAIVLGWLAWTVLRDRGERFVMGAIGSGVAVLLLLNLAAPDAIVARVNIARAADATRGGSTRLDLLYLARLSGEAAPLAVASVLAPPRTAPGTLAHAEAELERCDAIEVLARRWGPESATAATYREPGAWRRWNAGEAAALRVVAENASALRTARHDACRGRAEQAARTTTGRTS
jgi:hypothetical protein